MKEEFEFALCVQPGFSYEDPFHFVEWIEFYRLMGVQRFTFYNESIGPETSCLMKCLEEEGLVEILNWTPVYEPEVEIHVHSQMIQIADCNYRYRGRAKYLVGVDFDELIVPSFSNNFTQLIDYLAQKEQLDLQVASALVFRNSVFEVGTSAEDLESPISDRLNIAKYNWRIEKLSPFYSRSKYIGVPSRISDPGVHYVYRSVEPYLMFQVPADVAFLHHYRRSRPAINETEHHSNSCNAPGICGPKVLDRTAERFISEVSEGVEALLRKYSSQCLGT